jgi:phospholipid/cholesterol/gamma-HCH transport system substrate-binding protein
MKSRKINYVVVGGFVLVMLVALTFSIAMLSGHRGDTEDYYALYDNVSGIGFGTKVLFEGYHVGQVENITPVMDDGGLHFRVDMSIVEKWRVPVDSVARKESGGLLSAVIISISAGESTETFEPGSQINSGASTSIFDVVSQVAADAGDVTRTEVKPLLVNINKILSDDNIALVNSSLKNLEESTGDFVSIASDFKATSSNLHHMIESIDAVVSGNKENVDKTLADLRYSMGSVARHVDAITRNFEGSSRHMYEFSRQIRLNPGLLLGGKPPRDEADAAAAERGQQ